MTGGTLKGEIVSSGKKKTSQYKVLIKKLVLYCGEQGYRCLPEVIQTLKDKPPNDINFNKPDPNSEQWIVKTFVPIHNGDGSVVTVDGRVQKEKQMVEDELKNKLRMAKWSDIYKTKMLVNGVSVQNKEAVLHIRLAAIHQAVVQQMENIEEYKEVEKKNDLVGTLCILKEICFMDQDGGLTFRPMSSLRRCEQGAYYKQHSLPKTSCKDNVQIFFDLLKLQTRKFPFGIVLLLTIIKEQPDSEGTKPSGVMKQPDKGGTDDDDDNDNGNEGGKGITCTHLTMDEDDKWYQDDNLIS